MGMLALQKLTLKGSKKSDCLMPGKIFVHAEKFFSVAVCTIAYSCNALVDERLAGEGTGKGLGINDPILGWVILGVFTTVWGLYYAATKELGGQQEEDGLGL